MNEAIKNILNRKSIRKYKNKTIDNNTIELLLKSAMAAPSARNSQPWHFVVIEKQKTLNTIAEQMSNGHMLSSAPLCIAVCSEFDENDKTPYYPQDCSAATQNILLAVESLKLGAVWIACYPRTDRISTVKEILNLPKNIIPISLIAIGESDETPEAKKKYKKEKIHYEQW